MERIFCQDEENPTNEEWKWYRRHLILGVAAKDTCITPVYSNKRKRKDNEFDEYKGIKTDDSGKELRSTNGAVHDASNVISDDKKPSGYTFLTSDKTSAICKAVSSKINPKNKDVESRANSFIYVHDYLCLPRFIQMIVVPTFCFSVHTVAADMKSNNGSKYTSKQLHNKKSDTEKQHQSLKNKHPIPNGTQNSVALDTPHGWQSITPEQYAGVVAGLAFESNETANHLGFVGLFDHLDITNQVEALCGESKSGSDDTSATLKKQAMKKITTTLQKCTSWSSRIRNIVSSSSHCNDVSSLWVPVNIFASFLPEHVLSKSCSSMNHKPGQAKKQNILVESSNVAIVGWEMFPPHLKQSQKRKTLNKLIGTLQSMSRPESEHTSKQFLLLAVNDVTSILDAARESVSIIGTDLVTSLSCEGVALVLDLTFPSTNPLKMQKTGGRLDLKDTQYAKDHKPILQGCTCLTCRVRKVSKRPVGYQHFQEGSRDAKVEIPAFSRAYIHHLIQAKEMLADTLLFIHNLHQMIILFRMLSEASTIEAQGDSKLESFCKWVERQL